MGDVSVQTLETLATRYIMPYLDGFQLQGFDDGPKQVQFLIGAYAKRPREKLPRFHYAYGRISRSVLRKGAVEATYALVRAFDRVHKKALKSMEQEGRVQVWPTVAKGA